MAVPSRAAATSPPSTSPGRPAPRSPVLGLVALLLVPVVIALMLLSPQIVASLQIRLTDVELVSGTIIAGLLGMAVALLLGLVAVVTGRGRALGVVAIVLALLLNPLTIASALALAHQLAPGD